MGPSGAECARRLNVTRQAFNKAARSGRVHKEKDGSFDWDRVQKEWTGNVDPLQQARGSKSRGPAKRQEQDDEPESNGRELPQLRDVQVRKEIIRTQKEKLLLDELKGKLVDVSDIARQWAELVIAAKTALVGLGSKLAPFVAIETEAPRCQQLIDAEVYEILNDLSQWTPPSKQ